LFWIIAQSSGTRFLVEARRFGKAQPAFLDPSLLADELRFFPLLIGQQLSCCFALLTDEIPRRLQLRARQILIGRVGVESCGSFATQRLHLRVLHPELPDLLEQGKVPCRDFGETILELLGRDLAFFAEEPKEAADGPDPQLRAFR
jgi:hypothetical protein